MNTLIICATVVGCIFIICYYINKITDKTIENDSAVNSMFDDMATIKDVVDRSSNIDFYCELVKHNLLTIKNILSKYIEDESTNTSSKES